MKTMILKYNTMVATDPQSAIEGYATELGLRVDEVKLVDGRPGTKHREIVISGDPTKIESMGRRLTRLASVTAKII